MKVRDILKAKGGQCETIHPEATIKEAMDRIMDKKIGALPVMKDKNLVGIITERDIFRLIYKHREDLREIFDNKVADVMTTHLIIGVPDDDMEAVEALMTNNRFRHLPILDGKKLAGIVSIGDVVKMEAKNLKIENRYLQDYIVGKYPG